MTTERAVNPDSPETEAPVATYYPEHVPGRWDVHESAVLVTIVGTWGHHTFNSTRFYMDDQGQEQQEPVTITDEYLIALDMTTFIPRTQFTADDEAQAARVIDGIRPRRSLLRSLFRRR